MTPKRNRTSLASAGLKTALSLGVVTLVGCQSFNPNPSAPATGGAKPPATTGPVAPTGTTPAAKPPVKLTPAIKGKAAIAGKAMAGAKIKVIDAATGKPVSGLIAAGGGNLVAAGSGNYFLMQNLTFPTCDENGNFNVQFPALSGTVKFLIEGDDGRSISNMIDVKANEGDAAPTMNAIGTDGNSSGGDFELPVSTSTTLAAESIEGMLKLGEGLKDSASETLINNLFEKADGLANQIATTMTPDKEEQFFQAVLAGGPPDGGVADSILQTFFTDLGLKDEFTGLATDFMTEFAEIRSDANNLEATVDFQLNESDLGLLESLGGFTVDFSAESFSIEGNGIDLTADIPDFAPPTDGPAPGDIPGDGPAPGDAPDPGDAPPVPGDEPPVPGDEPPVDIPTDDGGASDENNALPLAEGVFRNSDTEGNFFSPDMSITASGSSLSLTVSQDAGEDDVREIVARFPKAKVTIAAPGGSWDANEVLASGTTDRDGTMSSAMIKYSAFTADAFSAAMDGETYSASSSQAVFTGYWMNNTTQLAKVVVYDNGTDVILSITYTHDSINDAATIENGGHETSLTTVNNVIQLTGSARADSLLTSRTNFTAERYDDLAP